MACLAQGGAHPQVYFHGGSTRKISQLTGDWDRAYGVPTLSQTDTRAQMWATDLGSSFEHDGKLIFLFGDTWGGRGGLRDTWGVSTSVSPWNLSMDVPVSWDGKWRTIEPPGLGHAEYMVPSHGISVNGSMYAVFTQPALDGTIMRRSYMIVTHNDGLTWHTLYELDNGNSGDPVFVNVWLERRGNFIYMFGSGKYRASSPTLARIGVNSFPNKSAWEYFAGRLPNNAPLWSGSARDSVALFNHKELGEFSCSWVEPLAQWVMLYNSGNPRGITMRTAQDPTGPWSAGKVIMDPIEDMAYGNYMHISWDLVKWDMMSDPDREQEFGGEYGPYLVSRFTTGTAQQCELYYTMSTWNPYQVVLMKSVVGTAPRPALPFAFQRTLSNTRWSRFPATVADDFFRDGVPHVTTYTTSALDASTGWLWQSLPAGTQRVSFKIHGGHAEVFLLENFTGMPAEGDVSVVSGLLRSGVYGRVVRRATGVDDNAGLIEWDWETLAYDRSSLGVVVMDDIAGSWGFVSLSQLTVLAPPASSQVVDWSVY